MDTLSFKPSPKVLIAELLKELLLVFICLILLYYGIKYKRQVLNFYGINTILFSLFDIPLKKLAYVFIVDLLYIFFFLSILKLLYKCIKGVYESNVIIEINLAKANYKIERLNFPLSKEIEEGTINQIISVDICQNFIERLLNCGHIYVEYLVFSKTGARAKTLCVPNVESPLIIKNNLLKH